MQKTKLSKREAIKWMRQNVIFEDKTVNYTALKYRACDSR